VDDSCAGGRCQLQQWPRELKHHRQGPDGLGGCGLRMGRREMKPMWPQVHVSRTSTEQFYAGEWGGQRAICSELLTPANAARLGEGRRAWTPNHLHQR
jgi:hypothetical protein